MKESLKKIYIKAPVYGVFAKNNLDVWGNRAAAISHHQTLDFANEAAKKETFYKGTTCVVVKYSIK